MIGHINIINYLIAQSLNRIREWDRIQITASILRNMLCIHLCCGKNFTEVTVYPIQVLRVYFFIRTYVCTFFLYSSISFCGLTNLLYLRMLLPTKIFLNRKYFVVGQCNELVPTIIIIL